MPAPINATTGIGVSGWMKAMPPNAMHIPSAHAAACVGTHQNAWSICRRKTSH